MTVLLVIFLLFKMSSADYWSDRSNLIDLDKSQSLGSSINLTEKENKVNEILMGYKFQEYDEGFADPSTFLPSIHFFKSRSRIEESEVFKILKKLPKGTSLHSHDTALVSFDYLYNLTYLPNLYGCVQNERLRFHFFASGRIDSDCEWELVSQMRENDTKFDDFLKSQISIIVDDPVGEYPTITEVWDKFMATFGTVSGLVGFTPVFQNYFYQALKELYEDNVRYIEFRGVLPEIYELNGTAYTPEGVVGLYMETLNEFQLDYPDFYGAKFIYAPSRYVDNKTADNYVDITLRLKKLYPDFIAGFDLVGQEDRGKPLVDFVSQLMELTGNRTNFFFHAGETDWSGTTTDMNLFDAVLFNTTRIGHGYAILKHPQLLQEVKKRDIALEISPISNQVLKLVDDLRNHPGAYLISSGFPVVITCDDPTFWGAKALSYDWYMAFMGLASRESDLKLLKQLAINSINYSSLTDEEKSELFANWELSWDQFLDGVLEEAVCKYDSYLVSLIR